MRFSFGASVAAAAMTAAGLALVGCADMRVPSPGARSVVTSRCADQRFPVYFTRASADLTPESLTVIRTASNGAAGCRVMAVDVLGVAVPEAAGGPADPALTSRRAQTVARALAAAGLPEPAFDIQVEGLRRLPPQGERVPLARRAEVVLHAQPG